MTRRVALYARVSTARQEQEQTIASQLASLRATIADAGDVVADEHQYLDEGYSGSRLARPGLDKLRDAAADGLLDIVFVYCPDRLARNFVHQQVLVEELQKRGVEVHFVERPIGERAEDRLLMQMQGVIAEYERAKIVERTRRGKLHKVKTGQSLPFTAPPYGYAIVRTPEAPRGVVVVDEVQAQHVREMFRWACDEDLSILKIARRLNQLGVPPMRASKWGTTSVYRILINPAYTGRAYYGKTEAAEPRKPTRAGGYRKDVKSSSVARPRDQWLELRVPPVVDEAVARRAREAMSRHRTLASRNVRHDYLLRALVTCGHCGLRMLATYTNVRGTGGYFYYTCRGRKSLEETCRAARCTAPSIRAEQLDDVAWNALVDWIKSPDLLREQVAAWKDTRQSATERTKDRSNLAKKLRQLDLQVERLVDAYQAGAIGVDELKERRERLSTMRDTARTQDQQLRAEEMSHGRLHQMADDITAFAATLTQGLDKLDFAGRQRLVRLLIERVVVKDERVTIEHVVPLSGRFSGLHSRHRAPR